MTQKPPRFQKIPQFTRDASYAVDVSWTYLKTWLGEIEVDNKSLDMDPDFQRGHVWTREQQVRYCEFILRGGASGKDIQCNCPGWARVTDGTQGPYVLVDGKQRVTAVLAFLDNEFAVFEGQPYGGFYRDFADRPDITKAKFRWHVNDLKTRAEVLQWYLDLNTGGTVHADAEITRVRALLEAERA